MAEYKNQHYVPQFYLRGFIEDTNVQSKNYINSLWILNHESSIPECKGINHICSESYFHSYINDDMKYVHDIEHFLSELESDFQTCISKLVVNSNKVLESETPFFLKAFEKHILLDFIIFQLIRVPTMINQFFELTEKEFISINKQACIQQTQQEIKNDLKKYGFGIIFDRNSDSYKLIYGILKTKNWQITILNKLIASSYISSDNPVVIVNPHERTALINPSTEISIPLTNRIALSLGGIGNGFYYKIENSESEVKRINSVFFTNKNRIVFSGNRNNLINLMASQP